MRAELEFWPSDLTSELPGSPLSILKKAANELEMATQGAVEAEVELADGLPETNTSMYVFGLLAKVLQFRYALFTAKFDPLDPYPVELQSGNLRLVARNSSELYEDVQKIARDGETIRVVKALVSQTQESLPKAG